MTNFKRKALIPLPALGLAEEIVQVLGLQQAPIKEKVWVLSGDKEDNQNRF